jgi:hypothetical protein
VGAAISIKNTEVATTNHVEVQVGEDVVRLGGVKILSVVLRPKQTCTVVSLRS